MTRSTRGIVRMAALAVAVMFGAAGPAAQNAAERRDHHEARERWQKVEAILDAMAAGPGAVVADVGAGGGFFTTRLSRAVGPAGRVLAVDIDTGALGRLRALVAAEALSNVDVITGAPDDPHLPAGALDAVLIVNAYHEMTAYAEILPKLRAALKPGGRLVIVEPISGARRGLARAEQTGRHEIDVDYVLDETRSAGFRPLRLEDPFTTRPGGHGEEWLLVLTHGSVAAAPETTPAAARPTDQDSPQLRVPMAEFEALVASGSVLVLDVRGDDSHRRGHLPDAISLPMHDLDDAGTLARLRAETRPIVTYCRCPAEETSARAALALRRAGIPNVRALVGGYDAWVARGGAIVRDITRP